MNALSRTLIAAAALGALGMSTTGASAANLHCRPDVKVINDKPASIKVLNFKYRVKNKTGDFEEGLNNRKIGANGDHETWKSQRLNNAAEDNEITEIAIDYKNDNSGAGDGYGPRTPSGWFAQTGTCDNDRTYTVTIK